MSRPFKFRYVNELAGAFVIAAVLLLLAGVFFAGRAQGWFERRFELHATLESEEGLFGLQVGSEVQVRNVAAGRVSRITLHDDGSVEITFVLLERFRPSVRTDSVAKIRRKFAVAGDAFVMIERGLGEAVRDGDELACVKDEEIVEQAQTMLAEVRKRLYPMLERVDELLGHVNGILGGLEKGEGVAGAVLRDEELARDIKQSVRGVNDLMWESRQAISETTRLIQGVQRHWLVRKYVRQVDTRRVAFRGQFSGGDEGRRDRERLERELAGSRLADDAASLGREAYNLGLCLLAQGDAAGARALLDETRSQPSAPPENAILANLLEAQLLRQDKQLAGAVALVSEAWRRCDRHIDAEVRLQAAVLLADLFCETGECAAARAAVDDARSLAKKVDATYAEAVADGLEARLRLAEGKPEEAVSLYDRQAARMREAGAYREMALALERSAGVQAQRSDLRSAADRYLRAGRSLLAAGLLEDAERVLALAAPAAEEAGEGSLLNQVKQYRERIRASRQSLRPSEPVEDKQPAAEQKKDA